MATLASTTPSAFRYPTPRQPLLGGPSLPQYTQRGRQRKRPGQQQSRLGRCQLVSAVDGQAACYEGSSNQAAAPVVRSFDFLVLGSGIAGLSYALKVAEYGSVAVVTKAEASEGCTRWAQGGISAVLSDSDSPESHIKDTMVAGDYVNDRSATEVVCRQGPAAVLELAAMGAKFTRTGETDMMHLTREGGHTHRRVVHAADATGAEVSRALLAAASAHSNIRFFESHQAVDFVMDEVDGRQQCLGVDVLDTAATAMTRFLAPVTLLATGGAGQVFPATTNPSVVTGDGIAMAARAQARLQDLEFIQFHPTGFAGQMPNTSAEDSQTFLISEAVRGEGGRLYNKLGHRFMADYDQRLELASRDIVARAIHDQMLKHGDSHVLLDITHEPAATVMHHFPMIAQRCASAGIDITQQPIPVAPVQHYMCGGVKAGLAGQTSLAGLFAIGEVACSGLHGANRLASNSLLEGLVFASRAVQPSIDHAEAALRRAGAHMHHASVHAEFSGSTAPVQLSSAVREWVAGRRKRVQAIMGSAAGIVRTQIDMQAALQDMMQLSLEAQALGSSYGVASELVELSNLALVGERILMAALQRRESRGAHFRADYPARAPASAPAEPAAKPRRERSRSLVPAATPEKDGRRSSREHGRLSGVKHGRSLH